MKGRSSRPYPLDVETLVLGESAALLCYVGGAFEKKNDAVHYPPYNLIFKALAFNRIMMSEA